MTVSTSAQRLYISIVGHVRPINHMCAKSASSESRQSYDSLYWWFSAVQYCDNNILKRTYVKNNQKKNKKTVSGRPLGRPVLGPVPLAARCPLWSRCIICAQQMSANLPPGPPASQPPPAPAADVVLGPSRSLRTSGCPVYQS